MIKAIKKKMNKSLKEIYKGRYSGVPPSQRRMGWMSEEGLSEDRPERREAFGM